MGTDHQGLSVGKPRQQAPGLPLLHSTETLADTPSASPEPDPHHACGNVLGLIKDTFCKTLFSLIGAIVTKLGGSGAGDVISAFPTLYRVTRDQTGSFAQKLDVLTRGIDQLPDHDGPDGQALAVIKTVLKIAQTVVGGASAWQTGDLTLVGAQNSLAALKTLLQDDALALLLPAHYVPGLAQAVDMLDGLLEAAGTTHASSSGSTAWQLALSLGNHEHVLGLLPQRLQWTVRVLGALGQAIVAFRAASDDPQLSLSARSRLFMSTLADNSLYAHLTQAVRDRLADGIPESSWLARLGHLLLSVASVGAFPLTQTLSEQWQWCVEWLRNPDALALTVELVGEERAAALQAFVVPTQAAEDPLETLLIGLMPESLGWLGGLFEQLADLRTRIQGTAPMTDANAGSWPQAAQLLSVVLESPLAGALLERLPEHFAPLLKVARGIVRLTRQAPEEQWKELMEWLCEPAKAQWLTTLALPDPDNRLSRLIESLANLQGVLRRCQDYPREGGWSEQLGWGVELLADTNVRSLLELLLPREQVDSLLTPFEWMNKVSHFPYQASARVQAEWIAEAVSKDASALTAFFPGVEQLQSGLEVAPLLLEPKALLKKSLSMAADLATASSPPAFAARSLLRESLPYGPLLMDYAVPGVHFLRSLPGETVASAEPALAALPEWVPAAPLWLKPLADRLQTIVFDPQLRALKLASASNPVTLSLVTLASLLRQIDIVVADQAASWQEKTWQLISSQFQWLPGWSPYLTAYSFNAAHLFRQWIGGKAPVGQTEDLIIKAVRDFKASAQVSAEASHLLDLLPLLPVLLGAAQDNYQLPADIQASMRLARAVEYLAASQSPVLTHFASRLQEKWVNGVVELMLKPIGGRATAPWKGPWADAAPLDSELSPAASANPAGAVDTAPETFVPPTPWRPARLGSEWTVGAWGGASALALISSTLWTAAAVRKVYGGTSVPASSELPAEHIALVRQQDDAPPAVNRLPGQWCRMIGGLVGLLVSSASLYKAYETGTAQQLDRQLFEPRPEFPDTSYFDEIYDTLMRRYGDALLEDPALLDAALDDVLNDPQVLAFADAPEPVSDTSTPSAQALQADASTTARQRLGIDLPTLKTTLARDVRERRARSVLPTAHAQAGADEWIAQQRWAHAPLRDLALDGDTRVTLTLIHADGENQRTTTEQYALRDMVSSHFKSRLAAQSGEDSRLMDWHWDAPADLPAELVLDLVDGMPTHYHPPRAEVAQNWQVHPWADAWIAEQTAAYPAARHLRGDSRTEVRFGQGTSGMPPDHFVALRETVSPGYVAAHQRGERVPEVLCSGYPLGLADVLRQGMPGDYRGTGTRRAWSVPRALLRKRLIREFDMTDSEVSVVDPDDDRIAIHFTPSASHPAKATQTLSLDAFLEQRQTLLDDNTYETTLTFPDTYSASMRYQLSTLVKRQSHTTRWLLQVFIGEIAALHRTHLKAQGIRLQDITPLQVRYTEQLNAQAEPRHVIQHLTAIEVADPAFRSLFTGDTYPRRSELEVGFSRGFPSRELAEIRDLLVEGLPDHYAPWGQWTRNRLVQQVNRRSDNSQPIARSQRLTIKLYERNNWRGSDELLSTHTLSLNDYLLQKNLPTPGRRQYLKVEWPEHFKHAGDAGFPAFKTLTSGRFLDTYRTAETVTQGIRWHTPRPLKIDYEPHPSFAPVPGHMKRGVFEPEQYETRAQYDALFEQARQRFTWINAPILEPQRFIQDDVERLLASYQRTYPSAPRVSGSDDVQTWDQTREPGGAQLSPDRPLRTSRVFKRWQLLTGQHKREEALSDKVRYTIHTPAAEQMMIDRFESDSRFAIEPTALAALQAWSEDAEHVENWQEVISGQIIVSVLERHEAPQGRAAEKVAIEKFLRGELAAQNVSFNDWPLDGIFFLAVEGPTHGMLFSVDSIASYAVPQETVYLRPAKGQAPALNKTSQFQEWIRSHLSVYHRHSIEPRHWDYKTWYDIERHNYTSINPFTFSGAYTFVQLPAALHEAKVARLKLDIDTLVYTKDERHARYALKAIQLLSQALALGSIALGPGAAIMVGLLSGAVDTAMAFAQIGQALSAAEENATRRSAILSAALTGLVAVGNSTKMISGGAEAATR